MRKNRVFIASASAPQPSPNCDLFHLTYQASNMAFADPGKPTAGNGQMIMIKIYPAGIYSISWGTQYKASATALPTTTATGKAMTLTFVYEAYTNVWVLNTLSSQA